MLVVVVLLVSRIRSRSRWAQQAVPLTVCWRAEFPRWHAGQPGQQAEHPRVARIMRQQPKLLYAVVARGTVTLAEQSNVAGNANLIAVRILEKLGPEDTRVSYSQERHMFHVLVQDGLTCMVMAEEVGGSRFASSGFSSPLPLLFWRKMEGQSSGRRIPFAFLDDIRARFYASYGNAREVAGVPEQALAYEYSTDFGPVLAERMAFFGNDPAADTITRVKGELLEVKNIMIENIEKVLERGEKLDLLVDKTDNLQNVKLWFAIGAFLLLLLYTVLAMTCGPTLSHC
ncbi:hypothetical protein QJQ45_000589 [Haematococcus lacustris]|nr:hypothetical protein QJQ45_000589 [Haematococcus lacustris]